MKTVPVSMPAMRAAGDEQAGHVGLERLGIVHRRIALVQLDAGARHQVAVGAIAGQQEDRIGRNLLDAAPEDTVGDAPRGRGVRASASASSSSWRAASSSSPAAPACGIIPTTTERGRISVRRALNRAAIDPSLMRFSMSGRTQYLIVRFKVGCR